MIPADVFWNCIFFQAVLRTIGSIHMIQKWLCGDKFMIMSWVNLCCFTVCFQVWSWNFWEFCHCCAANFDHLFQLERWLSSCDQFSFNHVNKTNGGWYSLKKSHLKGHWESVIKSKNVWFNNDRQMTRKVQGKVLGGEHRQIKWKL